MHGTFPDQTPTDAQDAAELLELGDAFLELDRNWRVVRVNRNQERLSGRPRAQTLGRTLWEVWPELARPESAYWREYHRCMQDRVPVQFQERFASLDLWTGVTAYPTRRGGIAVFFRDIGEQKRAEQALREESRRKDDFLGVLSHELRNPLAPIQNSVHTLAHADPTSDQAARARAIITRQVQHLTRLVDDLLDAKRIAAGKLRLRPRPMDVGKAVRDTVEDLRPLFAKRAVSLELQVPRTAPVSVNGDATRLAQAVGNLLQNALKFTNPGGRVVVEVERGRGEARIRVRDDGVGIEPAALATLFDPFVQAESTLHRTRSGLGLGLALVKGIAELHGGTVAASSEGPGRGAEFVLTLPVADRLAEADRAATLPAPGSRHRVLVIDDQADAAESLRDVLEMIGGHEVHVASSGEQGLDDARRLAPDVVLCDVGLNGLDGHEVARRIRSDPGARVGRLVALTGHAAPEDVERALRAGFDYHLAKPPDLERLLQLIADSPRAGSPDRVPADLLTGRHEVDSQHAAILAEAARLRQTDGEAVWESLRFLEQHVSSHFDYEERLMEDVGYPGLDGHRASHAAFSDRLVSRRDEILRDGLQPERVAALAMDVERWVALHVLEEDARLAEFVRGLVGRA